MSLSIQKKTIDQKIKEQQYGFNYCVELATECVNEGDIEKARVFWNDAVMFFNEIERLSNYKNQQKELTKILAEGWYLR